MMRRRFDTLRRLGRPLLVPGLVAGGLLLVGVSGHANAASGITAIPQSYNATSTVETGMLVELKPSDPSTIMPLSNQAGGKVLGVVVPAANAPVVLAPQASGQQVLVATAGHYNVLVSNQNGAIQPNDYLSVSAVDGVAMKAGSGQSEVIGKAAGNFDGTSNVIGSVALKNTAGQTANVAIGSIPVDIDITRNPLYTKAGSHVPGFLAQVATDVVGKPVPAARLYIGAALLLATLLIAGTLLYSGVRASMLAVGRNPLSKKPILRGLLQTAILGLMIFITGLFAVYLLLKL